jgi:hypothetical protein
MTGSFEGAGRGYVLGGIGGGFSYSRQTKRFSERNTVRTDSEISCSISSLFSPLSLRNSRRVAMSCEITAGDRRNARALARRSLLSFPLEETGREWLFIGDEGEESGDFPVDIMR